MRRPAKPFFVGSIPTCALGPWCSGSHSALWTRRRGFDPLRPPSVILLPVSERVFYNLSDGGVEEFPPKESVRLGEVLTLLVVVLLLLAFWGGVALVAGSLVG